MRMRIPKMTDHAHYLLGQAIQAGDTVIDATCGNGYDTVFLAQCVGESGKVYAFDIQEQAIVQTRRRLEEANLLDRVALVHDSHANLHNYVIVPVNAVVFNLGYLPGGNKEITTMLHSSMVAIQHGLELLQKGGVLIIVVYLGHDEGKIEQATIDPWAAQLDAREYQVLKLDYHNQSNEAPYILAIYRR